MASTDSLTTNKITRLNWSRRLCRWMEFPEVDENFYALVAWQAAEGGPNGAKFNPLNTTMPMPGATQFNFATVKNYKSLEQGLQATSLTLRQHSHPAFAPIRHSLLKARPAEETLHNLIVSEWGTGQLALEILDDVKRFWKTGTAYSQILISQ